MNVVHWSFIVGRSHALLCWITLALVLTLTQTLYQTQTQTLTLTLTRVRHVVNYLFLLCCPRWAGENGERKKGWKGEKKENMEKEEGAGPGKILLWVPGSLTRFSCFSMNHRSLLWSWKRRCKQKKHRPPPSGTFEKTNKARPRLPSPTVTIRWIKCLRL